MALYTLKSRDEAFAPLRNYSGNSRFVLDQISSASGMPNPAATQVYSALGRTTGAEGNGGDNFFVKRGKSIENAVGTTAAALKESGGNLLGAAWAGLTGGDYTSHESQKRKEQSEGIVKDLKKQMNDTAKNFGYDTWDDWSAAYAAANDEGNQEKIARFKEQNKAFQDVANAGAAAAEANANDYEDYRNNNYVSKKINQDQGKFAGSAINTLSTAVDLTGLGATPLSNAIQGGFEGLADELEQNGFENFDWQRAGQNALIGATTGAVTGALNKGISNSLAKNGGNLFKGGNFATRGLNNLGSKTALGRVGSTLATGAARGAVSGAVGGATGAGLQSALNGVEFGQGVQNALQGAVQGAQQGAVTGATMAGANMAISKTPGVGKLYNEIQSAKQNWDNIDTGDAKTKWDKFNKRFTETMNSGDSRIGNWLNRQSQSKVLGAAGNIGNTIDVDTNTREYDAWDRLAQQKGYDDYDQVIERYMEANPDVELNPRGAAGQILTWLDKNPNTPTTLGGWAKRAGERIVEDANNRGVGLSVKDVGEDMPEDIRRMQVRDYNADSDGGLTVVKDSWKADSESPSIKKQWLATSYELDNPVSRGTVSSDSSTARTSAGSGEFDTPADSIVTQNSQNVNDNQQTEVYNALTGGKTGKANKLRYEAGLKLAEQYGTIDKPTAKATDPAKTFTEMADLGFTKPADVERIANAMTGANGEMSLLVRNMVKTADPVDTFAGETSSQTLDDYMNASIQKHGLDGINEGKAVKSQINALMRSLPSHTEGSIDFVDAPEDVFKLTQQLDAEAANYRGKSGMNYGTTTPDKLRAAQVMDDVSNLLKNRIYSTADVQQALTPEVANNLKAYDPNNKAWAKHIDDEVMQMKNVKDFRHEQAKYVNVNKIVDNAYTNSMTYGGRVGGSGSPIPLTKRGLVGAVLNATVNSGPGLRTQAKVLNKSADIVDKVTGNNAKVTPDNAVVATPADMAAATANYNPSTQLYNAIGRTEGLTNAEQARTANYLADAAQEAEVVPNTNATNVSSLYGTNATNVASYPDTGATSVYNSLYGTPTATQATAQTSSTNTGYFQPTGDYWTDIIAAALSSAIDDRDVTAFTELYSMYQDQLASLQKQTSTEKDTTNPMNWSSADRTKLLSAQNAMGQIDQLEEAYNQATGGEGSNAIQGWLRSRASDISGGNWDPSASNYNSLAESVGMGIVKNLINLGVTEADAQRYLQYLPALTDTKEQAAQKLDTLRSIYQNQINNLYGAYGV